MMWTGALFILVSLACLIPTISAMTTTMEAADAANASPADLATGLSSSLTPALVGMPFGVLGLVLVIWGFLRQWKARSN